MKIKKNKSVLRKLMQIYYHNCFRSNWSYAYNLKIKTCPIQSWISKFGKSIGIESHWLNNRISNYPSDHAMKLKAGSNNRNRIIKLRSKFSEISKQSNSYLEITLTNMTKITSKTNIKSLQIWKYCSMKIQNCFKKL